MTIEKEVKILGFWASPYVRRSMIALAEKGVEYEYREENLAEKSELLLESNPIYKKTPVLIHGGKPVCESLIIIQYIDEGEAEKEAKKEFVDNVKILEEELGDKKYFGGESFGFVDIAMVPFTSWFYSYEVYTDLSIEKEFPKLAEWVERCKERESVAANLNDPEKICEYVGQLRKKFGAE